MGSFGQIAAALLPCMWGFSDLGVRLKKNGLPKNPAFRTWVQSYADPAFARQAAWCRKLLDAIAEQSSPGDLRRMEDAFVASVRYELAFWDMAWKQERWQDGPDS